MEWIEKFEQKPDFTKKKCLNEVINLKNKLFKKIRRWMFLSLCELTEAGIMQK